ncbi:M48 family metalloprotease [Phytomonospora sp. NPDC050363]|uniref:M48 family metalloprotease n=1 Tax=Phytomonospora sp. NPDC050363 TaxID=3155642 RepID=UPI0033CAEE6A
MSLAVSEYCPDCQARLVTDLSEAPWCPVCLWNLAAFEPADDPHILDRLSRRIAYRDTIATFERLRMTVGVPEVSRSRYLLTAISAVLLLATVGLAGLGVWLCLRSFPNWWIVPGAFCLAVAWAMRPRSNKLDEYAQVVEASAAPTLHALIDRVAAAAGTPRPQVVVTDPSFNTASGVVGLFRRRRVLAIGTALWIGLEPQERVALLAHEFGHFSNENPHRRLGARPALTVLYALADMTRPQFRPGVHPSPLDRVAYLLLSPLHKLLELADIGVYAIAMRESQRAEYRADAVAARIAGRDGMAALMEKGVNGESLVTVVTSKARAREFTPEKVRPAVREAMARLAPRSAHRRQLTIRAEMSLFASHPPTGLRVRLIEEAAGAAAQVACPEAESARIDMELAGVYEKARRDVARFE